MLFLQMECPPSQVAAALPTSSVESACATHGSNIPYAECTCSNRCGHFHNPAFPMTIFRFFTRFYKVFLIILLFKMHSRVCMRSHGFSQGFIRVPTGFPSCPPIHKGVDFRFSIDFCNVFLIILLFKMGNTSFFQRFR